MNDYDDAGWPEDAYDEPRLSEWESRDDARKTADESAGLRDGSVLIEYPKEDLGGRRHTMYSWRDSDVGMGLPLGSTVLEKYTAGRWKPAADR